jgi:hypothetical protein
MRRIDEAYMDAAARVAGIDIPPSSRAGVMRFLSLAGEMADAVAAAPLDGRSLDLLPVYRPPEPQR